MPEVPRINPLYVPPTQTEDPGAGRALSQLGGTILDLSMRERARQQRMAEASKMADAVADFAGAISQYRIDLEQDPDAASRPQKFADYADQLRGQFLQDLPDHMKDEFIVRAAPMAESQWVGVYHSATRYQESQAAAATIVRRQKFLNVAAEAPNPVAERQAMDLYIENIHADPTLTPEQRQLEIDKGYGELEQMKVMRAGRGVLEATSERAVDVATANAKALTRQAEHLSPVDRERLLTHLDDQAISMKTHLDVEVRRLEAEAQDNVLSGYIERLADPDPRNWPSTIEVAGDQRLKSGQKVAAMSIVERQLKRQEALHRGQVLKEVWFRIHDPSEPNPINGVGGLYEYYQDLNASDIAAFGNEIAQMQRMPGPQKELQRQFAEFQRHAVKAIEGSSLFGQVSPLAEAKVQAYLYESNQRWMNTPPEERQKLLAPDPDNPAALYNLWWKYRLQISEEQGYLMQQFGGAAQGPPPEYGGTNVPADERRKPGETPEQWRDRLRSQADKK